MLKIAMVEDDIELAQILTEYLVKFNIKVENFEDPFLALSAISLKYTEYDLIILDLTLPGLDGLEVCKELVVKYDIPIIISSARSDITDKVTALEIGADDYLPKPYDPRELEVRIKTILRRLNKEIKTDDSIEKNEIFHLDEDRQEITKNGQYIKFTEAEYQIMVLFVQRKGFIISRYDILDNIEMLDENSGSIAVLINRIRAKIEDDPKQPKHFMTIRGMGYKLVE